MVTIIDKCPITCGCGYRLMEIRITDSPIEEMPPIRCVGTLIKISDTIVLLEAFHGKLNKTDMFCIREALIKMGFKRAYMMRSEEKRVPLSRKVSSGFFKGWHECKL